MGSDYAAWLRAVHPNVSYLLKKRNAIYVPFTYSMVRSKAAEVALIDSRATENFMDWRTMKRLGIGQRGLTKARPIYNVDGTINCKGSVMEYCALFVHKGDEEHEEIFFVTDLGEDRIILGYTWLNDFNPRIDWREGTIKGPSLEVETAPAQWRQLFEKKRQLRANKVSLAMEWAQKGEQFKEIEAIPEEFK
jgi:hypothetical protein